MSIWSASDEAFFLASGCAAAMLMVRADDFDLTPDHDGEGEIVGRELREDGIILTVRLSSGSRCGAVSATFLDCSPAPPSE